MAESKKQTFYYRWDWTQCPESATEGLLLDLKKLLIESSAIRHIIIFGHSYGGVITANLIDDLFGSVEIHSVAAPLYGHPRLDKKCPDWPDFEGMEFFPEIAASLDIMMEESTTQNSEGRILNIFSEG